MGKDMTQPFDSLGTLLKLVSPCLSARQQFALLDELDIRQWSALFSEAERQGVTPLLYPLLTKLEASHALRVPIKDLLYQDFMSTAGLNLITLRDAEILLTTLSKAGIPVAGLKGVYLLEAVYGNVGVRTMTDIDILVKKKDLAGCIASMKELGYHPNTYFSLDDENIDTKHIPPMEKESGCAVEVHWTLLEENEPFTINPEALWDRMRSAKIANVEALTLGVEDLILHLCLHLTYQHYLKLGLRGLLDIALVIHKFSGQIDWQKLTQIAISWGSERVTALTLQLVETQLSVPIPEEVYSALLPEGLDPFILEEACSQLLNRVRTEDHFTPDLVELSEAQNLLLKMKIGLQRVFIPRMALARLYNVAPNSLKIMGYYFVRLKYLIKHYGRTLLRLQRGAEGTESALRQAETANFLHTWMTPNAE